MRSDRRQFDYKPSYEATVKIAERKGSMFDSILKDVKFFKAKEKANLIRILPPGWKDAKHFGLRIKSHRNIGPNDQQYLCLIENATSPYKRCPVCEMLSKLGSRATQQEKQDLKTYDNVLYYLVERDNEKEGVQVWVASSRTDSEIAAQSINRRAGSVLNITHPIDGFDIEFVRTGTTFKNTEYKGFQVMRESSPLSDDEKKFDEWVGIAYGKPLPEVLNFYSPERIEEVLYGRVGGEETQPDTTEDRPLGRTRLQEDLDDDANVPFDGGHKVESNGSDEDDRPVVRRSRVRPEPEEEEVKKTTQDMIDEEVERRRNERRLKSGPYFDPDKKEEPVVSQSTRERLRARLNRE